MRKQRRTSRTMYSAETFTCNRCGYAIPNKGTRWEIGGLVLDHMEQQHTPRLVPDKSEVRA